MKKISEKIEELKTHGFVDYEEVVKEWQDILNGIEIDRTYSTLKNTKEIIKACQDRVMAIDKKLLEERRMNIEDREYLLGVKDTLRTLVYWFNPNNYEERERSIEAEIDAKLEL